MATLWQQPVSKPIHGNCCVNGMCQAECFDDYANWNSSYIFGGSFSTLGI